MARTPAEFRFIPRAARLALRESTKRAALGGFDSIHGAERDLYFFTQGVTVRLVVSVYTRMEDSNGDFNDEADGIMGEPDIDAYDVDIGVECDELGISFEVESGGYCYTIEAAQGAAVELADGGLAKLRAHPVFIAHREARLLKRHLARACKAPAARATQRI